MSKVIRIENRIKQWFNILIEPNPLRGKWRTLSQGVIKYNMGFTTSESSAGTLTTYHLLLCNFDSKWGIRLNDFGDFWGANDGGDGILVEPWSVAFQDDVIRWEVVKFYEIS
jgi:hypothetical protein